MHHKSHKAFAIDTVESAQPENSDSPQLHTTCDLCSIPYDCLSMLLTNCGESAGLFFSLQKRHPKISTHCGGCHCITDSSCITVPNTIGVLRTDWWSESSRWCSCCRQVAGDLVEFVSKGTKPGAVAVLVAHNGNTFDNRMLTAEFKRCGMAVPQTWQWMDALPLARELLPQLTR